MIRQPGMKPKLESRNRPGRSFRRERSPVAPKRVITCGYLGPTLDAIFVTAQALTSTTRTVKTRNPTPAESNQREWRNLPRHRQCRQSYLVQTVGEVYPTQEGWERLIASQPPQHAIGPKGHQP